MGLFSFFKRKNNAISESLSIDWPEEMLADDVLNCCEQCGAFEALDIADTDLIQKICEDVASLFNSAEKSKETLENSFIQGFENNGFTPSAKIASMFISCYLESYVYYNA
ncbi:MAG: hypothetical protein E7375_03235 [Clostridiales bacterium]|nr:hypothetical protein [Clostridiales bacterium]